MNEEGLKHEKATAAPKKRHGHAARIESAPRGSGSPKR